MNKIMIITNHDYIVVMLSGGLDSTYTVYKLLKETDPSVIIHIHHCEQKKGGINNDQWKVENIRIPKIIEWFRNEFPNRQIQFTSSKFEYHNPYWNGWDLTHFTIFSVDIARAIYIKDAGARIKICLGIEKTINPDELLEWRMKELDGVFRLMTKRMDNKPEFIYPIIDITKQDILKDIPHDLLNLTWSCRSPQQVGDDFIKCGICPSCREIAIIQGRLDKTHLKVMAGGI